MLSVVVMSLLGLAAARECQYALYEDPILDLYIPLGINRCHYHVTSKVQKSMLLTCEDSTTLKMSWFQQNYDCSGLHNETTFTTSEMVFDCSSDKTECGKLFGFKTPCDCTKEDGNCDYAFAYSIVDGTCVRESEITDDYQEWDITCGSVSEAKAEYSIYSDSACNSEIHTESNDAGCQTSSKYYAMFHQDEVDWIVCPANIHTFSITMIVGLIVAALL